jgi:uncharacterized protein (TIGR00369 family)
MDGRKVSESRFVLSKMMEPQDTNPFGSVHGGVIMKNIDVAGAVAAMRHCRSNAVTVSVDRIDFIEPVRVGELVLFKATVNAVGRTSMEVGVRVEAENLLTGNVRYVASAYITFVAVDANGKPCPVPPLAVETEEEARRCAEAALRRETRLTLRRAEAASQAKG